MVDVVGGFVLLGGAVEVVDIAATLVVTLDEVSVASAIVDEGGMSSLVRPQIVKAAMPVRAPPIKTMRSWRDLGTASRLRASWLLSAPPATQRI